MCILLRRLTLKRNINSDQTRIAPLDKIRSITILIDRSDAQAEECYSIANDYLAAKGLRGKVFIIDMTGKKPIDKDCTISRRTLTLFGRPRAEMRERIHNVAPDLLICLSTRSTFLMKYLILTSAARFRIGRVCKLPKSMFNMVFDAPDNVGGASADLFRQIVGFLEKIR